MKTVKQRQELNVVGSVPLGQSSSTVLPQIVVAYTVITRKIGFISCQQNIVGGPLRNSFCPILLLSTTASTAARLLLCRQLFTTQGECN